jgi:Na+-transporting methylmalonyl-CoA/oxaloacetate decarboxylase gamma subunit
MENSLFMICMSALASVFAVLGLLAVTMKILTGLFPAKAKKDEGTDSAVLAAIHSAYAVVTPGARITNIEEMKGRR